MAHSKHRIGWLLCAVAALPLAACLLSSPVPTRTMDFEEGIRALTASLGDQLVKSSIGNIFNKVVKDPVTKHKQMKKIAIDPFVDAESGYPVKASARIVEIVTEELKTRFEVTGTMDPDNLEAS